MMQSGMTSVYLYLPLVLIRINNMWCKCDTLQKVIFGSAKKAVLPVGYVLGPGPGVIPFAASVSSGLSLLNMVNFLSAADH